MSQPLPRAADFGSRRGPEGALGGRFPGARIPPAPGLVITFDVDTDDEREGLKG